MFRSWKILFLATVSIFLLAACGQSLQDRAAEAVKAAEEAFYANDKESTEEIDGVKLYKPAGFDIVDDSDTQNIVFEKGKDPFILFVNPNEEKDSHLFYDLLLADKNVDIIAEAQFDEEDTFGFVAVIQHENASIELVASVGGAKMTTLTKEKHVIEYLEAMMNIVRSIR